MQLSLGRGFGGRRTQLRPRRWICPCWGCNNLLHVQPADTTTARADATFYAE